MLLHLLQVTEDQNLWTLNVALYNISNNMGTKQNAIMGMAVVSVISFSFPRLTLHAGRRNALLKLSGKQDGEQLYAKICMPLSKPIISLIALQTFIGNWNDFGLCCPFLRLLYFHL